MIISWSHQAAQTREHYSFKIYTFAHIIHPPIQKAQDLMTATVIMVNERNDGQEKMWKEKIQFHSNRLMLKSFLASSEFFTSDSSRNVCEMWICSRAINFPSQGGIYCPAEILQAVITLIRLPAPLTTSLSRWHQNIKKRSINFKFLDEGEREKWHDKL